MKITISRKSNKMGEIPSFNLPPVESCLNHSSCERFIDKGKEWRCYAVQPYTQYAYTKAAWDRNYYYCQNNLDGVEEELHAYFKSANIRLFRIHVSGDFFSKEYLQMWLRVIRRAPQIRFLIFTKVYGFFYGKIMPDNLSVIFSFMPDTPYDLAKAFSNRAGFPIAYVGDVRPGDIKCPEQTTSRKVTCLQCEICWKIPQLKRPVNICFEAHR